MFSGQAWLFRKLYASRLEISTIGQMAYVRKKASSSTRFQKSTMMGLMFARAENELFRWGDSAKYSDFVDRVISASQRCSSPIAPGTRTRFLATKFSCGSRGARESSMGS